jgi:hypothetical protein
LRTRNDFEVIITADGSPSLMIADSTGYVEKMHHTAGAMTETVYIYGSALNETLDQGWPLHVLSLGLGLGYNELLVAGTACARGIQPSSVRLYSFESESLLSQSFLNWVKGAGSDFSELYADIRARIAKELSVNENELCRWLKECHGMHTWQIRGAFPTDAEGVHSITCILYDAFSNKMTPELWSEEVLTGAMTAICAPTCVFATYASTGNLKRAFKKTGFGFVKRRGFAGRRESSLAIRGTDQ